MGIAWHLRLWHYEQIMADDYRGGSAIVRVKYLKSAWKALQETAGD